MLRNIQQDYSHIQTGLLGFLEAVMEKKLDANDVKVYCFDMENDATKARSLRVYETGEIENGLKGFYEEDMKHLEKFLERLKRNQKN